MIEISKRSLYSTLGTLVISVVMIVMGLHAYLRYDVTKADVIRDLKLRSELAMNALSKNVATYIEAYRPGEYEQIIANEMGHEDFEAIIVEDYVTGAILGEKAYVSGQIRDPAWRSIDYDPSDATQMAQFTNCFLVNESDIVSSEGSVIGHIIICTSDRSVTRKIESVILHALVNAVGITVLLILLLFVVLRRFVIMPLSKIVDAIEDSDDEGLPKQRLADLHTSREITSLAGAMNRMFDAVNRSRKELREQHDYLQAVVDGIGDPLMVINTDYTVRLMNSAMRDRLRSSVPSDLLSAKCHELVHDLSSPCRSDGFICPLPQSLLDNREHTSIQEQTIDGQTRYTEVHTAPLFDKNGRNVSIIVTAHDITDYLEVQNELREQKDLQHYRATHDALTGLANRVLFQDRLEQSLIKARRAKTKVALLFIDLDHFKEINDSLGHKSGDKVLTMVTERFRQNIRSEDTLARLGGDEFTIILEGLKNERDASMLAEKIILAMKAPMVVDGQELYISSSIGISIYPDNAETASDMLKNADAAMYRAKSEGRKNYQYYSEEMTLLAFERITLEASLRDAVKHREFVVHYQPQINTRTGHLVGMEALVRWQSPVMGLVPPGRFLPIAEVSGLIVELDRFVMKEAMKQFVRWERDGLSPGVLSMNLTVKQMQQDDFIDMVRLYLETSGCKASHIELEVTEGQLMTRPDECNAALRKLGAMGIKIAMDDFGTGYSSLSYLKKLPLSKLKIDRSFVLGLPDDEEDAAIAKAVIALAKSLNLEIIAEGVETETQAAFLRENGCENIQGYLYAQPMDADAMEDFLIQCSQPPSVL